MMLTPLNMPAIDLFSTQLLMVSRIVTDYHSKIVLYMEFRHRLALPENITMPCLMLGEYVQVYSLYTMEYINEHM